MTIPLVECIPYFSEARRPEVIEAIIASINSVAGVQILDRHSDIDHNRTVITFAGTPEGVEEAAFQAIQKASQLIDLNIHQGQHPRIGAADVVPLVPLRNITTEECVLIARRLGQRVAETLNIPVYLYEEAATSPERRNLENLRRGQYEGLKTEITINPERAPDFGPARLGTAGATVIGARQPLIAFNVYLNTSDLRTAQKIARAARFSGGGLRYLKAIGVMVDGMAQIPMNLTNYRQTSISHVLEMVRREAERYGTSIHHTELVGLIPQDAIVEAARYYLQLDQFSPEQTLEQKLYLPGKIGAEPFSASGETPFLNRLAAGTPTPGGGSAAAYTAALGAALVSMAARVTVAKEQDETTRNKFQDVISQSESIRLEMQEAVNQDCEAFEAILSAGRLPADTPDEQRDRAEAQRNALLQATNVPMQVARKASQVIELAAQIAPNVNPNTLPDLYNGIILARAALTGSEITIRANLKTVEKAVSQPMINELQKLEHQAGELDNLIKQQLRERSNLYTHL